MLSNLVLWYGFFSLSHLFVQVAFGNMSIVKKRNITEVPEQKPSVAVIIPEYNEDPELLEECIDSSLDQDFQGRYHVIAIDDGSKKKDAITAARNKYGDRQNLTLIELQKNVGKRHAQKAGFDLVDKDYDYIVTLDSDTILEHDAISKLIQQFEDESVGAITGQALVHNRNHNLLTRLIFSRYWAAFNQERAAQSLFGSVLCATGVISAYRSCLIRKLKERYVSQMFAGQICTYGDDRHLTNLVLEQGYKVMYEPDSRGWTDVPKNMKAYLKQQLRWNRSFYRELIITARMIWKKPFKYPAYMIYDLGMQTMLPFLLIASISYLVYMTLYQSPMYIAAYLGVLVGISFLRSLYASARTGDKNFYLFPLYALIHLFLLIPLRLYAIFSLKTTKWGTR